MPMYHIIIKDVQVYDFTIAIPATLTVEEREEFIWEELAENRDAHWKSGEESIVVMEKVK